MTSQSLISMHVKRSHLLLFWDQEQIVGWMLVGKISISLSSHVGIKVIPILERKNKEKESVKRKREIRT